jgi:hypothetical protein
MKAFIVKMGSTADYRAQTYEVVVDWVPTMLDMGQMGALESIEQASGLQMAAIREARWIKPIHLRTPGQRTALAIFGFSTREGANHAIGFGLFVEGKKVWARKQLQEPRRCLKCQCFWEHRAAKCASIHEVCGRCRKQHRTSDCQETDQGAFTCSNCKTANNGKQGGHGASDRRCPVFLEHVEQVNRLCRENKYRFFCTADLGLRTVLYTDGYTVPSDGYSTRTVTTLSLGLTVRCTVRIYAVLTVKRWPSQPCIRLYGTQSQI